MAQQIKHSRTLPQTPYILAKPSLAAHYLLEGRTLICIVRHGQTDWNQDRRLQGREDIPLNETGIEQITELASLFGKVRDLGITVSCICSSPLSRAVDTANPIADVFGVKTVICNGLIERDYGKLAGLTVEERRKKFPGGEKQAGDVESVPSAASRMINAFDTMVDISGGGTIIGVSHGGIINAAFSRLSMGEIGTGKTLTTNCGACFVAVGIGMPIPLAYNLQGDGIVEYISKILYFNAEL